jgi:hypothetical protein
MLRLLAEGDIERVMDQARENMLLLGVNLHYVVGNHQSALLRATRERGVLAQVYLLDQQSQLGKDFYSEDGFRDHLRDSKAKTFENLRKTQTELRAMHRELKNVGRGDRLKVWLYKYISMYTAVAIDAETEHGRMIISPHLYSVDAKHPPLFELTKSEHADLYGVYWRDVSQFVQRVEKRHMPFEDL